MAVLTYTEIATLIKDLLVINTATDPPIGATELTEAINDAYKTVWEISGGGIVQVAGATAWATASNTSGITYGLLTDIKDPLKIYASPNANVVTAALDATVSSTTTAVSSAAAGFGSVVRGMHVLGATRITDPNTFVVTATDASNLVISKFAATSGTDTLTFSDKGEGVGTKEMEPAEFEYIQWLKKSDLTGTYARPKLYSLTRLEAAAPAAATAATANLLRMDFWPAVAGFVFPMTYVPQFTPMDAGSSDVPTVNDIESYDIAYLAALDLAPRCGRAEMAPGIAMKVSDSTQKALDRKLAGMISPDQDDTARN